MQASPWKRMTDLAPAATAEASSEPGTPGEPFKEDAHKKTRRGGEKEKKRSHIASEQPCSSLTRNALGQRDLQRLGHLGGGHLRRGRESPEKTEHDNRLNAAKRSTGTLALPTPQRALRKPLARCTEGLRVQSAGCLFCVMGQPLGSSSTHCEGVRAQEPWVEQSEPS